MSTKISPHVREDPPSYPPPPEDEEEEEELFPDLDLTDELTFLI